MKPVLLYDGECGLCNRVVRLLLRLDRRGVLRFAPLQKPAAQEFLRRHGLPVADFDSLVFVPRWGSHDAPAGATAPRFLLRTDGVIAALRTVGGAGRWLAASFAVFPAAWRDGGYRLVARWRYRIFGAWRPAPLPRPEWAARFFE